MVRLVAGCVLVAALLSLVSTPGANAVKEPRLDWAKQVLARASLPVHFVQRPASLLAECRRTARLVGYPVPCPSLIPAGITGTLIDAGPCRGFRFGIVGVACSSGSQSWRGWVVGSSQLAPGTTSFQHLVIQAAPRPVGFVRAVDGPGSTDQYRVDAGGRLTAGRWHGRWVFVNPATNPGSAFMGHLVFVWTVGGHTYAVGFHAVTTMLTAAAMDYELVRHIELIHR
jgi:hypothetical protein